MGGSKITVTDRIAYKIHADRKSAVLYDYLDSVHCFPVAVKGGNGAQAEDFEGKRYIDFGSGIGTNSLGFCNDKWIQAVVSQVKQL